MLLLTSFLEYQVVMIIQRIRKYSNTLEMNNATINSILDMYIHISIQFH